MLRLFEFVRSSSFDEMNLFWRKGSAFFRCIPGRGNGGPRGMGSCFPGPTRLLLDTSGQFQAACLCLGSGIFPFLQPLAPAL